jgi:hypothetical protein
MENQKPSASNYKWNSPQTIIAVCTIVGVAIYAFQNGYLFGSWLNK